MPDIELYNKKNIAQLEWPDTEDAKIAHRHLLPMIEEGVQPYIRNVDTQLFLLKINCNLIPITVNQCEYDNSYLTSNYFPIKYMEEQFDKQPSKLRYFKKSLLKSMGFFLKGIKINKVVIINNWLVTTNIYPKLTDIELQAITDYLCKNFSDHILLFKNLNAYKCQHLQQDLKKNGYRILYTRQVSIYDPTLKPNFSSKVFYHHRRDRRLIEEEGYEIVRNESMSSEDIKNFITLYNGLYLDRHTKYSPQYTEKFLKSAVENRFLQLVCLKKAGEIKGVIGFHERASTLIAPFCGYDKNCSGQLYRMLTMLAIDEAEKRSVILNDGSGGSAPKQYRGMKSFPEYIALYDKHLPYYRRLFWAIAEKMVSRIVAKLV